MDWKLGVVFIPGDAYSVAFSPDGKTLASGSADHTVRLWRTRTDERIVRACYPALQEV